MCPLRDEGVRSLRDEGDFPLRDEGDFLKEHFVPVIWRRSVPLKWVSQQRVSLSVERRRRFVVVNPMIRDQVDWSPPLNC